MSIFFDFKVGLNGRRFRRAVDGDKCDIEVIIEHKYTEKLFGKPDIGTLIELSTLSICMINENKEVIGFMALCDHPNIPGVDPSDWEVWLHWTSRYLTFKKHNIYKYKPKFCNDSENTMYFYTALRNEFCAKLKIRRAVEEDNDDIVRILAKKCPRLHELYGEFYISEIIGRHPETDRQIIVADQHDQAVGVMCLNSEINYDMLQNTYEVDPFHGLKKATPLEKERYKRTNTLLHTFGEPIMNGKWSPFDEIKRKRNLKIRDETESIAKQDKAKKSHSKVNFVRNITTQSDDYKHQYSEDYSERELRSSNISLNVSQSVANILEEEPFDYEIVNIDKRLLTVPEVLSCDFLLQGFHLLEAAFEIMKEYDYCIIRVPCKDRSFHLLQHFCFVPPKNNISSDYALYVAHRSSVLGKLRVRRAEIMDIPQIAQLLKSLDNKETLWTIENTILLKNKLQCYVLLTSTTLVGIGIIEQPEQIDFIRAKFNLDAHRLHKYYASEGYNCGISTLKAVLVYPVFEAHFRFFAREMMRFSGSYSILWLTAYRNKWLTHKANSLVGSMIPLLPRKSEIDCTSIGELRRIRKLSKTVIAFSSWFLSKKLTSIPQINVDTRLVIVGASRTAMAFLNTLLFSDSCSYLLFTNVTLISPNGLPYNKRSKPISEMMFKKYRTNSEKFLKSVPYTYYVNIIQATMVEINKREKYITLSNKERCAYDMLFLLFGKQFQHPDYLKSVFQRSDKMSQYTRLDVPKASLKPVINYTPTNVFIVNTLTDANRALNFVKAFKWNDMDYDIIVYGATKHAYCCLATLVEMKIPVENIIFVEPFPHENIRKTRVSYFCNVYIDKSVTEVLKNLRIKAYRSYYFQNWVTDSDNFVTHVDFLSHHHFLRLKCSAFFYYGFRGVNKQAFIAIHKSGIAYDGGILIDHEFRTKDHSIYAAGPATRYYRKYYADNKRHKYYDAYEIGSKLGYLIRNQLDPLFTEVKQEQEKYTNNSVKSGLVMETFKEGYFKLHLTNDFIVDGITCLTPQSYSLDNFTKLYGLSATVLNNVHLRYTAKKLDNFYKFFRAPWAYFIYHDQSKELFAMAKELLPKGQRQGDTLAEAMRNIGGKLSHPSFKFQTGLKIKPSFEKSPHVEAITDYVIEWLSEHDVLLPMYLQPWQVTQYGHDTNYNPALGKKKNSIAKLLSNIF
ncbi:unnamed protein product, partial [Brenthis ino]